MHRRECVWMCLRVRMCVLYVCLSILQKPWPGLFFFHRKTMWRLGERTDHYWRSFRWRCSIVQHTFSRICVLGLYAIAERFRFTHLQECSQIPGANRSEAALFSPCVSRIQNLFVCDNFLSLNELTSIFNGMVKMQRPRGHRGLEWRVMNGQGGRSNCGAASWPGRAASKM